MVEAQKIMRGGAEEEWKHGLLGLCDNGAGTCLYGWCCGPCAAASARSTLDGSTFFFNCCCVGLVPARNIVREGYNIKGSACGDILIGICCQQCAAIQLLNETKARGAVGADSGNGSGGPFKNGLMGCTKSIGTCCFACCCPQIVASQARSTYDGSDCWFNCLCMPLALTRNVIRQGYHMEGGWMEDCILSACCAQCVAAQLAYEVADRGPIKSLGKVLAPNQVVPEGAFMVSVPPGAVHGTTLSVTKPSTGQPMLVMVPPGVVAGQQFMVVG